VISTGNVSSSRSSQGKVCAIVLDYRGAQKTAKCLRSLVGHGIDQIIVVDNSADAKASRELSDVLETICREDPEFTIRLLTPEENLGFAKGMNFALQHAAHSDTLYDYYLLINNDAEATPNLISQLKRALDSDPQLCLVAPSIFSVSGKQQALVWYHRYFGLLTERRTPLAFPYLTGCCLMFRRNLAGSGKLFDEDFFMYGEDAALGWKLSRAGKEMRCLRDALVQHEGGASSSKAGLFYEYHLARAHLLLALKTWRSPVEIPFMILCKLLALAARAFIRCVRYRSAIPLYAYVLSWLPLKVRTP